MLVMLYDPARRAPASHGDFLGIISLGCITENMWLMAEFLGIGFHIVSSLGEGLAAQEVKRILAFPIPCRLSMPFAWVTLSLGRINTCGYGER
jgi:hypothetical protein